MEVHITRIIE